MPEEPQPPSTPGGGFPPNSRRQTWDSGVADELRSLQEPGEPDLVAELVATFRAESDGLVLRLREAVTKADLPAVAVVAHTIKGASANLGAERLARTAGELERAARAGDRAAIVPLAEQVIGERDRFLAKSSPK